MKTAATLHQKLSPQAKPDEMDVIIQASEIKKSLTEMGYDVSLEPVTLNLKELQRYLIREKPNVVVNLVETLGGQGRLIHLVAAILEYNSVSFTGNGQYAIYLTTGKIIGKREMTRNGLPTPAFFHLDEISELLIDRKYILKPTWEDASVGISDRNVVTGQTAHQQVKEILKTGIKDWLFEEYIEGREFNVSLLETAMGWRVLRPAEINFMNYPQEKPRILGYESKWDINSFEYANTVRSFETISEDVELLKNLNDISLQCVEVFKLGGYARVDFRVDEAGNPWILEVNANPCLSPDAGFYAACQNEGMSYKQMISHIIDSAFKEKQR